MSTKKSEVDLDTPQRSVLHSGLRPVVLALAMVSVLVGLGYLLRNIYRFHMWNW